MFQTTQQKYVRQQQQYNIEGVQHQQKPKETWQR